MLLNCVVCLIQGEITKVKSLGVGNERIIYANPCKSNSYIKFAATEGVDLMTFDNEAELYKIKQLFPDARSVGFRSVQLGLKAF
jgi:ornithine decarboxylase